MWDSKLAIYYSQGTHNLVSQGMSMSCEETNKSKCEATERSLWLESFSGSKDMSTITSSHDSNRKAARHWSVVRFKKDYPPHRIDCPLVRKPGESNRAEEKPIWDTACSLRGKRLDMPCVSYWGWLSWFSRTRSHFVSFKNRNHWTHFESCLKSSSDHGAICIKLDLVENENFSTWTKCTRNQHSRVIA